MQDPCTAPLVYNTEHLLPTIIELMTIYVETGPKVFTASCQSLMSFLSHRSIKQVGVDYTVKGLQYSSYFESHSTVARNSYYYYYYRYCLESVQLWMVSSDFWFWSLAMQFSSIITALCVTIECLGTEFWIWNFERFWKLCFG